METNKKIVTMHQADLQKVSARQKVVKVLVQIALYAFLIIMALIVLFPFYWMIISSLKTLDEYRLSVPTFWPKTVVWRNYIDAFNPANLKTLFFNTMYVGIVSTILSLVITVLTAFAFARLEFKGKDALFAALLATMMIPGELFTITNYGTVTRFGWLNTYTVLIVPFLVSVYYIFLLRNNFKQIPDSLYKAAKVDGTSEIGYLIKVMVPLTAPTLISVTLLKFIGTWNSYIWPRLVNKKEEWRLISNWVTASLSDKDGLLNAGVVYESYATLKMAAAFMVSLPLFVLFICFRKYIMHGVSKSGTKG